MKKYYIYACLIIVLLISCFFIWNRFKEDETIDKDSQRFSEEYTSVPKDNIFVYRSASEIIKILEKGTGVVYLGFPECPWCQAYVKFLNEEAKSVGIQKIYYYNIKNDRANNTENYKKIVSLLSEYLMEDDEGNKRVYVPDVTMVKNGEIVGHHNETSVVTPEDGTPEIYWTKEKIKELKDNLNNSLIQTIENTCTTCN